MLFVFGLPGSAMFVQVNVAVWADWFWPDSNGDHIKWNLGSIFLLQRIKRWHQHQRRVCVQLPQVGINTPPFQRGAFNSFISLSTNSQCLIKTNQMCNCSSYNQANMLPHATCLFLTAGLMPLGSLDRPSCWNYRNHSHFQQETQQVLYNGLINADDWQHGTLFGFFLSQRIAKVSHLWLFPLLFNI